MRPDPVEVAALVDLAHVLARLLPSPGPSVVQGLASACSLARAVVKKVREGLEAGGPDLALGLVAVGDEAEVLVRPEVDGVPHREPEDVVRRLRAPADVHVPLEEALVEAPEGLC